MPRSLLMTLRTCVVDNTASRLKSNTARLNVTPVPGAIDEADK